MFVNLKSMLNYLLIITTFLLPIALADNSDGWKMTDRFYGFRYVIYGEQITNQQVLETVQNHAHSLGCFGWVQLGKASNIVGEARCAKSKGKIFYEWLETLPGSTQFESLIYSDTKIRLHFSHFKILEPTRDTCFLDLPHQCLDISNSVKQAMEHNNDNNNVKHNTHTDNNNTPQRRTEEL